MKPLTLIILLLLFPLLNHAQILSNDFEADLNSNDFKKQSKAINRILGHRLDLNFPEFVALDIDALIKKLGDSDFRERRKAFDKIISVLPQNIDGLKKALKETDDP